MEKETYTIQEVMALIISQPFTKFTHSYFSKNEYIYGDGIGHLCDEEGYHLPWDEFWGLRINEPLMQNGWFIFQENQEPIKVEKEEKPINISEKEIQELYSSAKEIIKKFPNKCIKINSFNIYQPDPFNENKKQRVDYVQLIKSKLDFMHECMVNGQPWVAHLSHLPAEIRREILKRIIKEYS